ncbi:hypothetical protein [Saccharopolyspora spinosa]|uniref:hypothetical protein n=1 Tax=Saccharopolyspora spinosa TaxID=60894 RepID=UPI00192C8CF3|nr:hypothetical protein [Saccharopolyspora spinosa]
MFEQTTAKLPGGPWALHQLRHSALTHAAEGGANTSTLTVGRKLVCHGDPSSQPRTKVRRSFSP